MTVLNENVPPWCQPEEGQAYKRNTFNLHDAFLNCKSDSSLSPLLAVYNPSLTEGYRAIFRLFDDKESVLINSFEMVSIDKMAILFNAPSNSDSMKSFWKKFDKIIDFGNPEIMVSTPIYRRCCRWFNDYYIQWDSMNDLPTIRIEFNPNKADLEKIISLFSVMKSHALQFARVSRMDVCIDYSIYLNPLCWVVTGISHTRDFKYKNISQTRYFGSQQSDLQIRVYDKATELKNKQELIVDFDFWRVEAQIQAINGSPFFLLDEDTLKNFNPFKKLDFYNQFGFKVEGQGAYKAFVYSARAFGVDFAASLFNKDTRKKYLEQLKIDSEILPFHTPSELYESVFCRVYSMFINKIFRYFEKAQRLQASSNFINQKVVNHV